MKQLPIVQVGNPGFRVVCTPVPVKEIGSKATEQLVAAMKYTMRQVHGVGLAAPQVGVQQQLFVLRLVPTKFRPNIPHVKPYAVFNPKITRKSTQTEVDYEGCFSVAHAGVFAQVRRPQTICVQYSNEDGKLVEAELTGLEARVFMHEYDHLLGKVFFDRDADLTTLMSADEYKAMRARESELH